MAIFAVSLVLVVLVLGAGGLVMHLLRRGHAAEAAAVAPQVPGPAAQGPVPDAPRVSPEIQRPPAEAAPDPMLAKLQRARDGLREELQRGEALLEKAARKEAPPAAQDEAPELDRFTQHRLEDTQRSLERLRSMSRGSAVYDIFLDKLARDLEMDTPRGKAADLPEFADVVAGLAELRRRDGDEDAYAAQAPEAVCAMVAGKIRERDRDGVTITGTFAGKPVRIKLGGTGMNLEVMTSVSQPVTLVLMHDPEGRGPGPGPVEADAWEPNPKRREYLSRRVYIDGDAEEIAEGMGYWTRLPEAVRGRLLDDMDKGDSHSYLIPGKVSLGASHPCDATMLAVIKGRLELMTAVAQAAEASWA